MLRRTLAPTSLLAMALVGCGGDGASASPHAATPAMRATVARTLASFGSLCAYQRWGPLQNNAFGDVPTDGFSAVPPDVSDPLVGTPESGPLPTSYENDGLGLWEDLPNGDYSRENFYTDETMAQPAGFSTDVSEISGETRTETDHYEINAGDFAGSTGDSTSEFRNGTDAEHDYWHRAYRSVASDGAVYSGEFTMIGLAYTATATTIYHDGTKDVVAAEIDAKDKGTLTFTSHDGITLTAKFTAASVANGTLTGSAEGLPATFSLDLSKHNRLTVRFSDGTTTQFKDGAAAASVKLRNASTSRHLAWLRSRS